MAHPMDEVMQPSPRASLLYPSSTLHSLILPFRLCFDSVKHAIPLKAIGHSSIMHGYQQSPWWNCTCIWRDVMGGRGGGGELLAHWRESSLFNAADLHLRTERPIASSCQFRAKC